MKYLSSHFVPARRLLIAGLGILFLAESASAREDIDTVAIVTVYSGGVAVTTYKAVSKGRMEGNCYVFHIRDGVSTPEVRVCGNFTVQNVP